VTSREETAMSTRYLHLVRMDVAHDREAIFNDIYDHEHIPALLAVPGVARASRYRHPSPTDPRYLAAYELESPRCSRVLSGRRRRSPVAGPRTCGPTS